jgi:hypothetical protein
VIPLDQLDESCIDVSSLTRAKKWAKTWCYTSKLRF